MKAFSCSAPTELYPVFTLYVIYFLHHYLIQKTRFACWFYWNLRGLRFQEKTKMWDNFRESFLNNGSSIQDMISR